MTQPGPIHLLVATSSVDAANRLISGLRGAADDSEAFVESVLTFR